MSRLPNPNAVTLTPAGPLLRLAPALPPLGDLRVGRLEPAGGDAAPLQLRDEALFRVTRTPGGLEATVWAGLGDVVRGLLGAAGVRVRVPRRPSVRPVPVGVGEALDPAVVAFAAGVPRGLVRYDADRVDVSLLIMQVCRAFPAGRVVVVVRRRAEARELRRRLAAAGVAPTRAAVCTLGRSGLAGFDRADLVLVVDALHGTWADPLTAGPAPPRTATGCPPAVGLMDRLIDVASETRVVGFLPGGRTLSPFEQARAWQVYGPAELVVPRHGAAERPVATATHGVTLRAVPAGADDLEAKKAVWRDPVRNRRLGRLACALRAGDGSRLRADFPNVAAMTDGSPKTVLALCDGLDQARALAKMLPGWPVVSGLDGTAGVDPAAGAAQAGGLVATALGLAAAKLSGGVYDVVVRADPGRGLPPLPPGWRETDDPAPRPLLVVDVGDEGHPLPAVWSRMRRRAYRAAGWARAGVDPDVAAWARFRHLVLDRRGRP